VLPNAIVDTHVLGWHGPTGIVLGRSRLAPAPVEAEVSTTAAVTSSTGAARAISLLRIIIEHSLQRASGRFCRANDFPDKRSRGGHPEKVCAVHRAGRERQRRSDGHDRSERERSRGV
jgi:hypothetical protein